MLDAAGRADMSHDSRKPSWKNPGGGAAKGPSPSQKRDWHPTGASAKPAARKGKPFLLVALAGAILLGLIVAVILLLRPPKLARLMIVGPSMANTLAVPSNVPGANAAKALVDWTKGGKNRPRLVQEPTDSATVDDWFRGFDEGKENTVIVFLTLQGGADATGPYVWLAPPEAANPTSKFKLYIKDALNKLAQLPEKTQKLLILDATQDPVSYVHGALHNDFARALKKLDGQIESIPNLVVMSSSNEDERSWVSEEWQTSIFAHLFVEGAKGAAGVDRVTLDKLFEYLNHALPEWAMANRGEQQTPLLLPKNSGPDRAKRIEIASVQHGGYAAPAAQSAPGAGFDAPTELAHAWEQRERLSGLTPSPEAIAPQHWRRHLDTLLRIERNLRDGAPRADVLAQLDRLSKNEASLSRNPWPELSSLGNALPMPSAIGSVAAKSVLDAGRFVALWTDPTKEWPDLRQSVESQGEVAVTRLHLEVCSQLLDYLVREDRPENLPKAARLLQIVFGPSQAPIEVHLIRLFDRDLDATNRPPWPLIKQALLLQRQSEETALTGGAQAEFPAIEQVYPWLKASIAKADTERLRGDDLLISSEPSDWTKAGARFTNAAEQYRDITRQAKQIRDAMSARNTALAQLPYYGRWVAGLSDEFDDTESRTFLERVERIAESAHRLSAMLEESDPARLGDMNTTAAGVRNELSDLTGAFFQFIGKLNADVLISRWHHIDNALQVPFIPAKRRLELLNDLRTISHGLNSRGQSVESGSGNKPGHSVQASVQRQGRVALALLGSAWVNDREARDQSNGAAKLSYDELRQRIMSPKPEWWDSLDEAGEQIGWHWRALAERVSTLADKANSDSLESATASLARADTLARSMDSACTLGTKHDPVIDYRRYRLHDFLLAQAKRSIDANWAAVELAAVQSFAQVTAERFVNDAEKLIMLEAGNNPTPEDRARLLAAVKPVRDALKIPQYAVHPSDQVKDLTDQQRQFALTFTLQRPSSQTAGYPVIRFSSGGPARVPSSASSGRRPVVDFVDLPNSPQSIDRTLNVEVNISTGADQPGFVSAELWHRGHRFVATTRVDLNREPSSIWVYKPPRSDPGFAVRAGPDLRTGAVAILLDWTISMSDKNAQGVSKYDQAIGALEKILASLPEGTIVSITQFGPPGPGDPQPIVLGPEPRDFKHQPGTLANIINALGKNQPCGTNTPLAHAIVKAADQGLPSQFIGFKTILVLTDGDDNVSNEQAGDEVVRALANRNIALKMIFLLASKGEEEHARTQFRRIEELDPPGEFYTARTEGDLIAKINDAMLPRVRTFHSDGQSLSEVRTEGRGRLPVTLQGTNLYRWSPAMAPGSYMLRALNSRQTSMLLSRGDRLSLELVRKDARVEFRPRLFIPDVIRPDGRELTAVSADGQKVHAGLANCRLVPHEGDDNTLDLEMLLLLERERQPEEMHVTRPEFTWIEVRTQNEGQGPNALMSRVENELDFPSPAYKVRIWKWPAAPGEQNVLRTPSRPAITIWWRDTLPGERHPIRRDVRKTLAENFEGRSFTLDEKEVKIESIRMDGNYLTLQVSFPPGPPVVFVRTAELVDTPRLSLEEEHRFYEKTGKYTARFGPLSEEEQRRAFTLEFYSMAKMKLDASKIELRPNVSPSTSDLLGQDTPRPIKLD